MTYKLKPLNDEERKSIGERLTKAYAGSDQFVAVIRLENIAGYSSDGAEVYRPSKITIYIINRLDADNVIKVEESASTIVKYRMRPLITYHPQDKTSPQYPRLQEMALKLLDDGVDNWPKYQRNGEHRVYVDIIDDNRNHHVDGYSYPLAI